jgi:hypothetical protein
MGTDNDVQRSLRKSLPQESRHNALTFNTIYRILGSIPSPRTFPLLNESGCEETTQEGERILLRADHVSELFISSELTSSLHFRNQSDESLKAELQFCTEVGVPRLRGCIDSLHDCCEHEPSGANLNAGQCPP